MGAGGLASVERQLGGGCLSTPALGKAGGRGCFSLYNGSQPYSAKVRPHRPGQRGEWRGNGVRLNKDG